MSHPSEKLREEVAYLSHRLHWPYETVMSMSHLEREEWVRQTARLDQETQRPAAGGETLTDLGALVAATRRR
ncbi:MAG: hypothetical protein H6705_05610 [Myxococcales bacterium]|nr:hypothetical protein [Myxococcales bacterium]